MIGSTATCPAEPGLQPLPQPLACDYLEAAPPAAIPGVRWDAIHRSTFPYIETPQYTRRIASRMALPRSLAARLHTLAPDDEELGVFLELAEAREERVDQLRDAVGVARIILGRGREQHHAGRDRRNLGLHFDQVWIIVMVETRRQIDGFEARAECDGQKMQALICRDPRDHGHRLRALCPSL